MMLPINGSGSPESPHGEPPAERPRGSSSQAAGRITRPPLPHRRSPRHILLCLLPPLLLLPLLHRLITAPHPAVSTSASSPSSPSSPSYPSFPTSPPSRRPP